ncbi:hypothetical protein IMZ29_07090 [Achromobacter sp. GG226]|uniref:hypothetical protein n=1 Tax=Verticiella alkaliphila TaxID=2779529 RepID=UPI001C0E4A05|nr:hypothetical protein [Verticiella sp. GG226]MBU4610312.1 hypothetical protein [Verticiella sp. GG226]
MSIENDSSKLIESIKRVRDIRDLYVASASDLSLQSRMEAHAKVDLQEVATLWKAYAPAHVQAQPAGTPEVVRLANVVAKHFTVDTGYAEVNLVSERDMMVRSPVAGQSYKGPILGVSEANVLQRDMASGDVIVHVRQKLIGDLSRLAHEPSAHIRYPHGAIGLASSGREAALETPSYQISRGIER